MSMEHTRPSTGYDTKHHFRYVLAQDLALSSRIDTLRQLQSADKLEYFRRHLTRKHIGKTTILLLILALALFFHGIYLTLATEDFEPRVAFRIIGSFIGAAFLWRRGGILWEIENRIHALEREIEDDEGDFQMDEIKSVAEEINIDALAVFSGVQNR